MNGKLDIELASKTESQLANGHNVLLSRQKVLVHLEYKLITSKRLKLESCAKSQIVRNSFALLYLVWFFKIGLELIKILPPEVDRVFL